MQAVLQSMWWQFVISFIIITSSVHIGVTIDCQARYLFGEQSAVCLQSGDRVYTTFFTFELLVRWGTQGFHFLSCDEQFLHRALWNYLDIILVTASLLDWSFYEIM